MPNKQSDNERRPVEAPQAIIDEITAAVHAQHSTWNDEHTCSQVSSRHSQKETPQP